MQVDLLEIRLWGKPLGAMRWDSANQIAEFNYHDDFIASGLAVSPFMAPLTDEVYLGNRTEAFAGLPEFIADSLPDKFGNAIISAYFETEGISGAALTPLDKLAYIGDRAMGALTFHPVIDNAANKNVEAIAFSDLVSAARKAIGGHLDRNDQETEKALHDILSVGISAGGARAKAVINFNRETAEMTSGQFNIKPGFEPWLLKFDGMGKDEALGNTEMYGRIEYAYYLMATSAGITMMPSRLLEENGRAHFMTKRFDRQRPNELTTANSGQFDGRLHLQSYCAMKSADFNFNAVHSYESYFMTVQTLLESAVDLEQAFKRCCFNVIARNQDDHTKNLSFMMDHTGQWFLSPAYDVTYAYNPNHGWTAAHQMSVNGKFSDIQRSDLLLAGADFLSKAKRVNAYREVLEAVKNWPDFAKDAGLPEDAISTLAMHHVLF